MFYQLSVMVEMLVSHFTITVTHLILALVTNSSYHDFFAMADWSPKLAMSCTPMHIHSEFLLVTGTELF